VGKSIYVNFSEIDDLQTQIMIFVDWWVHEEKTPIPLKKIIENMTSKGIKTFTTIKAINVLLKKGYIRRAYTISNKSYFVMLRKV
jgi:predicted GNAT superfamily acetyltransferase